MATLVDWILLYEGIPPEQLFANTRGQGTPIIINTLEDLAYYFKPGFGVTPLGGSGSGIQKYQLACSDLGSDLVAQTEVGYFSAQTDLGIYKWGASLLYPGTTQTVVDVLVGGESVLTDLIIIPAGEDLVEFTQDLTSYDIGTKFVINITEAGTGAKGLNVFASGAEL